MVVRILQLSFQPVDVITEVALAIRMQNRLKYCTYMQALGLSVDHAAVLQPVKDLLLRWFADNWLVVV